MRLRRTIPSPTPRAPHAVQLYPTVRQPLAFGAAGLRLVLSPRSAMLQIARLSVLQTSASPRCDLLRARARQTWLGNLPRKERLGGAEKRVGGEGRNGETGKEVEKELRGRECGGETRLGLNAKTRPGCSERLHQSPDIGSNQDALGRCGDTRGYFCRRLLLSAEKK